MGEVNVFLSYRREDTEGYAGRLFDRLNARFPKRVFMDVDSILAGANFVHELEKSIKASDALVALIGRQWLTSSVSGQRRIDDSRDSFASNLRLLCPMASGSFRLWSVGQRFHGRKTCPIPSGQ